MNKHVFEPATLSKPTWCTSCSSMLWNFSGLQCVCGTIVHNQKCAANMPDNCPAEVQGELSMITTNNFLSKIYSSKF
jgi:hypothetical protein